jgi:hypothetical protein
MRLPRPPARIRPVMSSLSIMQMSPSFSRG